MRGARCIMPENLACIILPYVLDVSMCGSLHSRFSRYEGQDCLDRILVYSATARLPHVQFGRSSMTSTSYARLASQSQRHSPPAVRVSWSAARLSQIPPRACMALERLAT